MSISKIFPSLASCFNWRADVQLLKLFEICRDMKPRDTCFHILFRSLWCINCSILFVSPVCIVILSQASEEDTQRS